MLNNGKFRSELAKADFILKELETKLQQTRLILAERKAERTTIDNGRHQLERTGDINRLMAMKQRSIALDKSIVELTISETECLERIESARRYVQGLTSRLDKLREEAASLAQKISKDEVPADVLPQVQNSLRRVQMQIEALTGAKS
jgi:chromosome segregation ATPase